MKQTFRENSELKITKLTVGKEERIVPFALEAEVKNGSDLADTILAYSKFKEIKEEQLQVNISDNFGGFNSSRIEQLQKDLQDCNLKITIKIELAKYE